MSVLEATLSANAAFASSFHLGDLPLPPKRKLAVLACMDARLTVEPALGLQTGDAHIIRNAGGIATDDAIRSLIISHKLLGTETFLVVNHTGCGMLTFKDEELQQRLAEETGEDAGGNTFHAFSDLEENVHTQVKRIRDNPFLPKSIEVHGLVYDVKSGRLSVVL